MKFVWEDRGDVHVKKDISSLKYWRDKCGETVWGNFTSWFGTYGIHICCYFKFDASPRKLIVSCYYHVLFAPTVFKVNTANIQCFWIFLDIQIMQDPLRTAVLTTIFFSWLLLPETWFSFQFRWQLNMLIHFFLWLKVYVAFNDLHNLKILLCECRMSFKMGSLRCVKYIEKQATQYQPLCGGQSSVPSFEKERSEENECLGGFKEFLP